MRKRFFALLLAVLLFTALFPLSAFADKYQNVKQNEFMKGVTMKEEEENNDFQSADEMREGKWIGATLGTGGSDYFYFVADPGIYWIEFATPDDFGLHVLRFWISSGSIMNPLILDELYVQTKDELAPVTLLVKNKSDVFITVSKSYINNDYDEMPYKLRYLPADPAEDYNSNWTLRMHSGQEFNYLPHNIESDFIMNENLPSKNAVAEGYYYLANNFTAIEEPLRTSESLKNRYQSLLDEYGSNVYQQKLTDKEFFISSAKPENRSVNFKGAYGVVANGWLYTILLNGNTSHETLMNIASNFSAYQGICKSFTAPTPSPKPTPTPKPGPGPKDMKGCSSEVTVPNSGSWLNDYVTKSVKSAGGICIILRYYPEKYFEYDGYNFISRVYDGEKVTELARQDGYSLIKVNSSGAVGWAPSNLLVY